MKNILTSYNFFQNQLLNPVMHVTTTPPTGAQGQLYFDSNVGNKQLHYHNGTAWIPLGSGSGTVTSVTLSFGATTSSIFDTTGANSQTITSSGTFDISLNTQTANTVLAGPTSGGAAAPTFRTLVLADIPSLSTLYLPLAGGTMAGTINMNGNSITNLNTPSANGDAVSLSYMTSYVNSQLDGRKWKQAVKAATTTNITLSGNQTVDGVSMVDGDRILVKDQSTQSQNGIYVVASGAWTRSTDADTGTELDGAAVMVLSGTTNDNTQWFQTTYPVTIGSSAVAWIQTGSGIYSADGQGIEVSGNTFNLELDGTSLSKSSNGIKIANNGVTSVHLNTAVAGAGLVGGGGSALAVGAGTGITVNADDVAVTGYTPITSWTVARKFAGNFTVTSAGAFSQAITLTGYTADNNIIVSCRDTNDAEIDLDVDTTLGSSQITLSGVAPTPSYLIRWTVIA